MAFTGNKDLDMNLMMLLTDREIGIVCQVNKYAKKLCDDPIFWRKRLNKVFKVSPEKINTFVKKFHFDRPKDLYIYLTTQTLNPQTSLLWMEEIIDTIIPEGTAMNFWLSMSKKYPDDKPLAINEFNQLFDKLTSTENYLDYRDLFPKY